MTDTPEILIDDDSEPEPDPDPGYNDQDNDWSLGDRMPN